MEKEHILYPDRPFSRKSAFFKEDYDAFVSHGPSTGHRFGYL